MSKNNRILLIVAEMVITIFQPITCICVFFPLKISKLEKLFKFPVVQSGPTAGPLVNPIPLVPEKNQGPYPFGIFWICYWNTHVNTRLNMYWGKICTCILFKCYLFKTNFEVSNK